MGFLIRLVMILLLITAVVLAAHAVRWIAQPIERLGRLRRAPLQFTLADLLVLFAMLQFAVGTIHYLDTRGTPPSHVRMFLGDTLVADASAALVALFCWCCGVSMVSRAGISRWWHRAVILVFVVPCGTLGAIAMLYLAVAGGLAVAAAPEDAPLVAGIGCALVAVILACGESARRIAAQYPYSEPAETSDAQDASAPGSPPEESR